MIDNKQQRIQIWNDKGIKNVLIYIHTHYISFVSKISKAMNVSPSDVVVKVHILQELGLIERIEHEKKPRSRNHLDSKIKYLGLTSKGKEIIPYLLKIEELFQ